MQRIQFNDVMLYSMIVKAVIFRVLCFFLKRKKKAVYQVHPPYVSERGCPHPGEVIKLRHTLLGLHSCGPISKSLHCQLYELNQVFNFSVSSSGQWR